MRVVDPEQLPDHVVIEGTGASSSRDGAGNEQEATGRPVAVSEPQPRPAESSVGDDQPPREQRVWEQKSKIAGESESQRVRESKRVRE